MNTFLDLIEPTSLQAVEVLRGPNSAQYGSDAMGGSVQFLSLVPSLASPRRPRWRGNVAGCGRDSPSSERRRQPGGLGTPAGTFGMLRQRGRRGTMDEIRPGKGIDSHAAVTRFLGVSSDTLMDARLPDTEFAQYGAL